MDVFTISVIVLAAISVVFFISITVLIKRKKAKIRKELLQYRAQLAQHPESAKFVALIDAVLTL